MRFLLKDIVEQFIKLLIGYIRETIIDGTMLGYLSLRKMVGGYMVELYFHITKQTTQKKYRNKLINLFGLGRNNRNIDMFIY